MGRGYGRRQMRQVLADEPGKNIVDNAAAANRGGIVALASAIVGRATLAARLGKQFSGKRDLYETLGYKRELRFDDYWALYDRQDIAGRIVDMPASATWRNAPTVREDDDDTHETAFEAAWSALADRLRIWHYMERVDRLAGIGQYAVVLIGVNDGVQLDQPLAPGSLSGPDDVLYLRPCGEKAARIVTWDEDPSSPRFGRPELYELDLGGDGRSTARVLQHRRVHHSRVLHVADGLLEDEVYGRPRLRRAANLFDDMAKVVGGSAEMYWQAAHRGLHADVRDDTDITPEAHDRIKDELDEYEHGLRRFLRTKGMDINVLPAETADPRGVFEVLISLLAGATGIPKRVLLGAERGELASSQDETNWTSYVHERQLTYAEPLILRPFVDQLIEIGALPKPAQPYEVVWPNLFELNQKEKASVVDMIAGAVQKMAPFGETDRIITPAEFRERVLDGILGLDLPGDAELADALDDDNGDIDAGDEVDAEFRERVRAQRRRRQG